MRTFLTKFRKYYSVSRSEPSPSERRFAAVNQAFWRGRADVPDAPGEGVVLIELPSNDFLLDYTVATATLLGHARGLTPVGLVLPEEGVSRGRREILASFGVRRLFRTAPHRFVRFYLDARRRAAATYARLRTPEEVLHLVEDGVEVGDLIYDSILRSGYATLATVDDRVLRQLRRFYFYRALILDALERLPIRQAVFSHTVGIRCGIFARYLLRFGVPVLQVRAVGETNLKKYAGLDDIRTYCLRPEPSSLAHIEEHVRDEVLERAAAYLERRIGQRTNDKDAALAFKASRRTFTDRPSFAEAYGLDADKPNVFVMLHAFNDHPHTLGVDAILFRDYYAWFEETLRMAQRETGVNWIIKEHPAAAYYETRDVDLHAVMAEAAAPNIVFLDKDADFNAASLRHVADAVVTCIGTAGLEYSALGVPCVLAGRAPYGGFGFTNEPATADAYFDRLRRAADLPELSETQRERASIVLYFQLQVARNAPFFLLPEYDHYKQVRKLDRERFWSDAADHLEGLDPSEADREVEKFVAFMQDDDATQYLDVDLWPFMRGAPARPADA